MKIINDGAASGSACTPQELQAINAFAKAQLTAEEVYTFQVLLCDNEVDRDFERFSVSTIRELSELFVGATGICDHDWRSENQVARIYRTELVTEKGKTTSCGEPYTYLKGFAYMLRTEANAELIAQIDGGIKRETSIGCSVAQSICSICGAEMGACSHEKGKIYGGERCCAVLTGAVDAYEWSFAAVPAQRSAGVIKSFIESEAGRGYKAELISCTQHKASAWDVCGIVAQHGAHEKRCAAFSSQRRKLNSIERRAVLYAHFGHLKAASCKAL